MRNGQHVHKERHTLGGLVVDESACGNNVGAFGATCPYNGGATTNPGGYTKLDSCPKCGLAH